MAGWQGTLPPCHPAPLQLCHLAALLIFFALAVNTAVLSSPTVDESVHIFRGRVLWQTGQLRFQAKHAPFTHWLNGSLLFTEPTLPDVTNLPSWSQDDRPTLAREFLWDFEPQPNIERVFLLARLPIIWLGLLLGAVMMRWARPFAGRPGQTAAALLFAFSPNLLAHFSLATTDAPLTAMFVMAVFTWQRYRQRPSFWRWLLAGGTLGLALGSKLTAVLLLPILLILSYTGRRGQDWRRPGWLWLAVLPLAGLVFWALYGFELRPLPGMPFPVPAATYLASLLKLQGDVSGHYHAYLLGETSLTGWLYYFVVAFLIKTPVPTIILAGTAVYLLIKHKTGRETAVLWLPAVVVFAFASYSRLNIGYRHILPMLPFVQLLAAVAVGRVLGRDDRETTLFSPSFFTKMDSRLRGNDNPDSHRRVTLLKLAKFIPVLLMGWYIAGGLRQHPHHLAYFNELIGGPRQGYHYLADSNIDWGQSLAFLRDYVNESGVSPVHISYFGSADPEYYGLDAPPLFDGQTGAALDFARVNPADGRYALSVNHVTGQALLEPDMFDWFRRREPDDAVGYSILIYDVAQPASGEWAAICTDPAPMLAETAVTNLLGKEDWRPVYFDCRTSWVFPNDGAPGWYILPQQDAWPLAAQFPDALRQVYAHDASQLEPSYAVWYWDGGTDLAAWAAGLDGSTALPASFGAADLTGYFLIGSDWLTIWRVTAESPDVLTVAGHLYAHAPAPAVADGLGFVSRQWQPGDWFVQTHHFEENGRYLETGLYNYTTGGRLADFIQLPAPER